MLSVIVETIDRTMKKSKEGDLTLLYGAKDKKINNAVAIKEYVEKKGGEMRESVRKGNF